MLSLTATESVFAKNLTNLAKYGLLLWPTKSVRLFVLRAKPMASLFDKIFYCTLFINLK